MKAYHFLKDDMTSGEGNEPAWKEGEEREYKGKIEICSSGYHSSPSWYDALQYAPGNMACIVEISSNIEKHGDKQVSQKRKLIKARNAEKVLRTFACDCAERALKRANVTDERCWNAIKVSRLYNEGNATIEELEAAESVAMLAAKSAESVAMAAWSVAMAAKPSESFTMSAESVAWSAIMLSESAASMPAVMSAKSAVWSTKSAVMSVELKWQRDHLDKLMTGLFEERL